MIDQKKTNPASREAGEVRWSVFRNEVRDVKRIHKMGLSTSGSDQAREGYSVDALALRGDEGRGTLR